MTRSRQGKFCGGQPPLGLMRDPEDKGHLILDPETAPVISKILIGEVKKVDGQKVQEVRIVYNFVGEIPEIAT